jgi:hypothetical protein
MNEMSRTNRGRPYPMGPNSRMRGGMDTKVPGAGNNVGPREGNLPATCANAGDGLSVIVPGAGSVPKPEK